MPYFLCLLLSVLGTVVAFASDPPQTPAQKPGLDSVSSSAVHQRLRQICKGEGPQTDEELLQTLGLMQWSEKALQDPYDPFIYRSAAGQLRVGARGPCRSVAWAVVRRTVLKNPQWRKVPTLISLVGVFSAEQAQAAQWLISVATDRSLPEDSTIEVVSLADRPQLELWARGGGGADSILQSLAQGRRNAQLPELTRATIVHLNAQFSGADGLAAMQTALSYGYHRDFDEVLIEVTYDNHVAFEQRQAAISTLARLGSVKAVQHLILDSNLEELLRQSAVISLYSATLGQGLDHLHVADSKPVQDLIDRCLKPENTK